LIPIQFSDIQAAPLLCAGVIGYRALRLSGIRRGQRLGLYGFGASAHIALQIARHQGCEIYVFTRSKQHQDLAAELGAAWTGKAEDKAPHAVEGSIIFAPAGRLVPHALRALNKGGTVALAGIHMSPLPEMEYALLYEERTLRSVANSTRDDVREMLELAAEIPIHTEVETFPLEETNEALRRLKMSEIRGSGVVVLNNPRTSS
jgi:propanol-preferring alcohol dehydrogenase